MVPAPMQRAVTASWRQYRRAVDPSDQLDALADYRKSRSQAVAEVLAKATRKQAELTEQFGDLFPDTPAAAGDTTKKNDSDGNTTTAPDGQATL